MFNILQFDHSTDQKSDIFDKFDLKLTKRIKMLKWKNGQEFERLQLCI